MVFVGGALILIVARLLGAAFERAGQPRVVGEVLAGLVLGVSVLGASARDLFPAAPLSTVGLVALVPYLFRVTAGLDRSALRAERRQIGRVAAVAFAVPWLAGLAVGAVVGPGLAAAVFLATAFAVTALPVLARIVEAHGLEASAAGRIALGAAAAEEILIWPLVALAVALAGPGGRSPLAILALGAVAVVAIAALARLRPRGVVVLGGLALASLATDRAGLHPVLGAVIYAWALPPASRATALALLDRPVLRRPLALLLPLYFAVPLLGVDVLRLGWRGAALTVLFVAVASLKLPAAAAAAGLPARDALVVGVLMNARGLVALVVLAVGRDAGLLDARTYAAMVGMALITTLAAGSLLGRLSAGGGRSAAASRACGRAPARGSSPRPSRPRARAARRASG